MTQQPPSRADRYREKAEEARAIADTMSHESARAAVLEVATTWDRLADEEDRNQETKSKFMVNHRAMH